MRPLRAVHVGLGPIGRGIAEAVSRVRHIESVAAVDPRWPGRDLGDLTGGAPSGVRVAEDLSGALEGREADVALHCTGSHLAQVEGQLRQLMARGLDVVSTCEELSWPWFHHPGEARGLRAAAQAAGVRVLGTGVNPGFVMDLLPVFLGTVALRVDAVQVERVVDASPRRQPLKGKIGAGLAPAEFRALARQGSIGHMGLVESVAMIGAGMGWELDSVKQTLDPVVAEAPAGTAGFRVEAGQVRGLHQVATGSVAGEVRITLDLVMVLDAERPGDLVRLEGAPPLAVRVEGGIPGDDATAAAVLSAVPRLNRVPAGLLSVLDLPPANAGADGPG